MTTAVRKPMLALTLAALAISMGGCLSEEESNGGVAAADPVPPLQSSNTAPTISGSPGDAIMVGDFYGFTPSANDVDGDRLEFSIENRPRWAAFNVATGQLSGQPQVGDDGVYDQIVVSVSDGSAAASLAPFSITVTQGALGSMELSWTAPMENNDGTALTDLAGYRIYYGVAEGSYNKRIEINDVGSASIVVENLLPDTYYVVATAVNATGIESAYSNVVEKLVEGS